MHARRDGHFHLDLHGDEGRHAQAALDAPAAHLGRPAEFSSGSLVRRAHRYRYGAAHADADAEIGHLLLLMLLGRHGAAPVPTPLLCAAADIAQATPAAHGAHGRELA